MNIIALRLVTGEDVLGESISDTTTNDQTITLKNPVGINILRGKDGMPSVGFSPFPMHTEQKSGIEITLKLQHVVYTYEPAEEFVKNYNQIFGTGIVLPNKQIITC